MTAANYNGGEALRCVTIWRILLPDDVVVFDGRPQTENPKGPLESDLKREDCWVGRHPWQTDHADHL
jgi:hypothetical protein